MVDLEDRLGYAVVADEADADTAERDDGVLADDVRDSEQFLRVLFVDRVIKKVRASYESEFFAMYSFVDTDARHAWMQSRSTASPAFSPLSISTLNAFPPQPASQPLYLHKLSIAIRRNRSKLARFFPIVDESFNCC